MSRDKTPLSRLEALPRDMITQILSEVAKVNREDVTSCILASKELAQSANDVSVFKNMELNNLVRSPLLAANNYTALMEKCIEHSNPSAHYVKGILEYFNYDNPTEGLVHLFDAANATSPIPEAVYLYGIINLCMGQFEVGKHYIDQLRSRDDNTKADQSWRNIKRALHGIGIARKPEYMNSLSEMVPPFVCNINDMENTCDKCFHYKQMFKFIYTI